MVDKPKRPTVILDLDKGCTARQYADHLNMMLTYHIELDDWQSARIRELEAALVGLLNGPLVECDCIYSSGADKRPCPCKTARSSMPARGSNE
jgi:hypothetical protein